MYKKIIIFAFLLLLLNIPIFANENTTGSENIIGMSKESYKITIYIVEILIVICIIWISISTKKKNIKKITIEKEIEKRNLLNGESPKKRTKPKFMTRTDLQKMKIKVENT